MPLTTHDIAAARARIDAMRTQADEDERTLEAAIRLFDGPMIGGDRATPSTRRRHLGNGLPPQYVNTLSVIDEAGGSVTRQQLRDGLNQNRSEPITDGSFAALLSKMRSDHIETDGEIVRRKPTDDGGADVS